jgi:2-polyprenyl-6-methoxyphenol hydroxylase-like FAD-dependent oxidoreductase
MLRFNFITGVHSNLYKQPLMAIDNSTSEGGTGHVGFLCHKQPEMEKALRSTIEDSHFSQFRSSCVVTQVVDDGGSVEIQYENAKKSLASLRGKFLVGADGKTGYVRKNYLEPRGIKLEKCQG